jgi:hypothetical protein
MKESRFIKLAILGFTFFLGIKGIIAGPTDTPVIGNVSLLTISGYILLTISGLGIIALAYNSFKAEKK